MAERANTHLVGCAELPPGMNRGTFFAKLPLLEIAAFTKGNPAAKTVRTWREKSPESARFSIIASTQITHQNSFAGTDAQLEAVEKLVDTCKILGAEAVVFKTPANFSPSQSNRDRMQRFFSEIASSEKFGETRRVWAADGLWEADTVGALSTEMGILAAIDPLAQDPLGEEAEFVAGQMARGEAYLRVGGMGFGRRRFDGYQLEMLAEMLLSCERSWSLFAHPGKYPDALAMQRELAKFAELD